MGQNITWNRVPLSQISQQCQMHSAYGCAIVSLDTQGKPDKRFCSIFTPTKAEIEKIAIEKKLPVDSVEFYILGHELRHCFEGYFHQ
jgi:hypothetical protein